MAKSEETLEPRRPSDKDGKPPKGSSEPRRGVVRSTFAALGQFAVAVVLAPLVLVRGRKHVESVVVYSPHPIFFLWRPILNVFLRPWFVNKQWLSQEVAVWVSVWVLVYFIVTLLYDLSTRALALWIGIFSLIWLLAKYVEPVRTIAVLGYV